MFVPADVEKYAPLRVPLGARADIGYVGVIVVGGIARVTVKKGPHGTLISREGK